MLFLQIKHAEVALADGRLDEAYKLLTESPPLRSHRRGQALTSQLAAQLLQRGQIHYGENRFTEALQDCDKAANLAGNSPEVLALRKKIESDVVDLDRARRHEAHADALQTAAALVDSAIGRKNLDRAVIELVRARRNGCNDHRLRDLDENVRSTLQSQIEDALNHGRLNEVDLLMERLERLDPDGLEGLKLKHSIRQAHAIWAAIEQGRPGEAHELLHRLAIQIPDAKWIAATLEHLRAAESSLSTIRSGPLGLLAVSSPSPMRTNSVTARPSGMEAAGNIHAAGDLLPNKFIIQVDGAGSYLVLRQPSVTIGPISSPRKPDVGLITEASASIVTIERMEDDYFLRADPGAANQNRLLASGDRIPLSRRCTLVFSAPNPSSTSATLELASGRFPRADIRRIILMDRDLIIGPGNGAHIRVDQMSESVVVHIRAGQLFCRNAQVVIGAPTTVAGISFVATMG